MIDYLYQLVTTLPQQNHANDNHKLVKYGAKLRERYLLTEISACSLDDSPIVMDKIFNLAMIKEEIGKFEKIDNEYVRTTLTGKIDDILHMKSPIELQDILTITESKRKVILIEGAPGSGKTTLCLHIREKWSNGELFQQYALLILIQLRDPSVQNAKTIADLIPGKNRAERNRIAAEITARKGEGVLWILDGWDEFPTHLQWESLFHDMIVLPTESPIWRSTVIVTSRAISTYDFHSWFLKSKVSNRIELLGFTRKELQLYFETCLSSPTVTENLVRQIDDNPIVHSSCYLPLTAAIIARVYQLKNYTLPKTQYELFLCIILYIINRHIQKKSRLGDEVSSFEDFPDNLVKHFETLCKIAYDGIMNNKFAFHSKELSKSINALGLLRAVQTCALFGKHTYYHFLHLTFQEMLAAYYISKHLTPEEQVLKFEELLRKPRFSMVFQFYAAITKLERPGFPEVVSRIASAARWNHSALLALIHCVHQVQDQHLCYLVAKKLQGKLTLPFVSLNTLDCLAIGYFLSHASASSTFTANLSFSDVDDKCFRCLVRDLSVSTSTGCLGLYLPGYQLSTTSLQSLVQFLQSTGSQVLHSLSLGYVEPGHVIYLKKPTAEAIDLIAPLSTALTANNSLVELSLNKCKLKVTITNGSALSEMLQVNKSLQTLTLEGNGEIGNLGAFYIAEGIARNATLKILNISKCGITSTGAEHIAQALIKNKVLKNLNLKENNLLDVGIILLAKALKSNRSLENLNLRDCGMTDASLQVLGACIVENTSITILHIGNTEPYSWLLYSLSERCDAHLKTSATISENGMFLLSQHLSQRNTPLECLKISETLVYAAIMPSLKQVAQQVTTNPRSYYWCVCNVNHRRPGECNSQSRRYRDEDDQIYY